MLQGSKKYDVLSPGSFARARVGLPFAQGVRIDLSNALARDAERLTDLCVVGIYAEPNAHAQHLSLARGEFQGGMLRELRSTTPYWRVATAALAPIRKCCKWRVDFLGVTARRSGSQSTGKHWR